MYKDAYKIKHEYVTVIVVGKDYFGSKVTYILSTGEHIPEDVFLKMYTKTHWSPEEEQDFIDSVNNAKKYTNITDE